MGKKKVIVILTPGFARDEQDTTCIPFLQQYIKTLSDMQPDIELRVIAFQYPFNRGCYNWKGINIYSAGGNSALYNRLFIWMRVFWKLNQIKKQNDIAVIHSFWLTECTLIGQCFARMNKIKHVAYAIGQDVLKNNKYLKLLNLSNMNVVATSKDIAKRYHELTKCNVIKVIPSGIDVNRVTMLNEQRTIDILGAGALTPLKNYLLFVEIVGALKNEFKTIKASIIGKGEQETLLREKIRKERLEDNVQLIGELSHPDVFSYMCKSKILLHTSSYEGQSTVIMEALAMGVTVVCFDVGRVHEAEKIIVCNDKKEMIMRLRLLLNSNPDYKPILHRTGNDMVRDFIKVYDEL